MSTRTASQIVHDLLRYSEAERDEVVSLLARSPGERGSAARVSLPTDELEVQIKQFTGPSAWFRVWPQEISATGMGFVHGAFVHLGVACGLSLRTLKGEAVLVTSTVVRCDHIKGRAHHVSVKFDEPLALDRFVPQSAPAADDKSASGKPAKRQASPQEIKGLVGQLLSLTAAKECPAPIRKLVKQIAEALGAA